MGKNSNLVIGVAAGVALLSAAYLLKRNGKLDLNGLISSAGSVIDGLRNKINGTTGTDSIEDHGGSKLAEKARHKAEHIMAANRHN